MQQIGFIMHKKAIIFDLDNTLYAAESIGEVLFVELFALIVADEKHNEQIEQIKKEIFQKPFQIVAAKYFFSELLTGAATTHLQNLTYTSRISLFADYKYIKELIVDKYLVTSGFLKLQQSKILNLGIKDDFKEIHIIDQTTTSKTKKDVFSEIMLRNKLNAENILVIGDDVDSEIKAARELGMNAILYKHSAETTDNVIGNYKDLKVFL